VKKIIAIFLISLFTTNITLAKYDRGYALCFFEKNIPDTTKKSLQIKEIQLLLKDKYGFRVNPTGVYDTQTILGLQRFQYAFGLNTTGKINTETVTKIFELLGCDNILNGSRTITKVNFEKEQIKNKTFIEGIQETIIEALLKR
jgi:peptidoglycan hydrolase-like protein with peptidoglycan-binding domain